MATLDSITEIEVLFDVWEAGLNNVDPLETLNRIAELVEKETEAYLKMDPDPFDDRHPGRADPQCALGHLLKAIFKNDEFMNKLVNNYVLHRDSREINMAACRLLLDLMPGIETSVVFKETESLVTRLFQWAENAPDPLRSYATGLLSAAMEIQEIASTFREQNTRLVPLMLKRLWEFRKAEKNTQLNGVSSFSNSIDACDVVYGLDKLEDVQVGNNDCKLSPLATGLIKHRIGTNENSNSNWMEMEALVIGSFQMFPLNDNMKQRLILQYLTSMGEYQDFICHVFEQNILNLILHLTNLKTNNDVRLAFEALKYLATLLGHKKFAIEFLSVNGLDHLLAIHRPSVAATGVSMCLYYLAQNEDVLERVCLLPNNVLSKLVSFALWLLECSHDSGRCHATMFFGLSFHFQKILYLFDAQDGLRKLFNVISTLEVLSVDGYGSFFNDDKVFAARQTARHVCMTLKRYFEAHLSKKAEEIRRSQNKNQETSPHSMSLSKASKFSLEVIPENLEIESLIPFGQSWEPVDKLHELSGITHLLQLIAMIFDWNYTGRAETARSVLDILTICSITAKTKLTLCKQIRLPDDVTSVGMLILLEAAGGKFILDADVQRAALNVIINCVCGPIERRTASAVRRSVGGSAKKKISLRSCEDLLTKVRKCVQSHNGIMVLLTLLTVKRPITEADSIRALACKALLGLARCGTVKQIISKLPLFTKGQLQVLMKEPVLQDKRAEHRKFCEYASALIERVTGKPLATGSVTTNLDKSVVVEQTKIVYPKKDLLKLIHEFLLSEGCKETAASLEREAGLPVSSKIRPAITPARSIATTPQAITNCITPTSCSTPIRSKRSSLGGNKPLTLVVKTPHRTPGIIRPSVLEKSQSGSGYKQSPIMKREQLMQTNGNYTSRVTLNDIVTDYCRKQHESCQNPVVTCPPFSLFVPHSCPDPKFRNCAPANFTARIQKKSLLPPFGGIDGAKMDRKLIFSRFCPVKVFRDVEEDGCFTCGAFMACDRKIALGTHTGELKLYNIYSGQEDASHLCHDSGLTHCEPSNDGRLILTSSSWRRPLSALWSLQGTFENKFYFDDDHYMEFSRFNQDRIVGTKGETAHIYDVRTGERIMVLKDSDYSNNYTKNRATFSPTDELVLSDGVLWDVNSRTAVHKFDKFNPHINGVFHPNGLEIIANSEIWDLRTFHLLHTVPALDQCQVTFNYQGNVIYGAMHTSEDDVEMEDEQTKSPFGSSFRTLDSSDYSNIATIDIKKNIFDLCTDKADRFLAIIENQTARDGLNVESVCRLYEVGRLRCEEDEMEEEEEEEEDDDMESDDDDDDDDEDDDELDFDFLNEGSGSDDNDSDDDDNENENEAQDDAEGNENENEAGENNNDGGDDDEDGYEDMSSDDEDTSSDDNSDLS